MDMPGCLADVLSRLGSVGFLAQLAGMSPDDGAYFAAYVDAKDRLPQTPPLRTPHRMTVGITGGHVMAERADPAG